MYDLVILAGVKLQNSKIKSYNVNCPAYFDTINHYVVAEAGWLEEEHLRNRLERLSTSGYLCHHKQKEDSEESWFITRKGLGVAKYD